MANGIKQRKPHNVVTGDDIVNCTDVVLVEQYLEEARELEIAAKVAAIIPNLNKRKAIAYRQAWSEQNSALKARVALEKAKRAREALEKIIANGK